MMPARADKFLSKYLSKAPKSFIYKMMRKKNITLNKKKMTGSAHILPRETLSRCFSPMRRSKNFPKASPRGRLSGIKKHWPESFRYFMKMRMYCLSTSRADWLQKSSPGDISLVEYLTAYLLEKGEITPEELRRFRPSICNRLDRNTSGIVTAGKACGAFRC